MKRGKSTSATRINRTAPNRWFQIVYTKVTMPRVSDNKISSRRILIHSTLDVVPAELCDASERSTVNGAHIYAKELELMFPPGIGMYSLAVTCLRNGQAHGSYHQT